MRLIDADEIIAKINVALNKGVYKTMIVEMLNGARVHDVPEPILISGTNVKGCWDDYGVGVCCSNCGISLFHQDENNNFGIEPSGFLFCPFCGAEMSGERKDGEG